MRKTNKVSDDRLLTRAEAAAYLNVQPQTLATWHCTGRYGIPVVKVGERCHYRKSDLDVWLLSRTVTPGVVATA